jgi:RNA polymerase sigma-70 factor (ECF subfamily)
MTRFEELVEPHRQALHAHCYRMLGSVHDADDALQEALLGAWKGFEGFEGRSSLRSWLYTIATHAALRVIEGRRRLPSGSPGDPREPLGEPLAEAVWIEPYPDELARFEEREGVELAYIAALQLLAPNQRAVVLLRDGLGFSAAETASMLGGSVASVNSALQRGRAKLVRERPSQQETLRALGSARSRELVARFADAWDRADVDAIVALLREDASFSMPPLPTWFRGRADIGAFIAAARIFRAPWRFEVVTASAQPALLGYRRGQLGVLMVLTFDGPEIAEVTAFLGAGVLRRFRPTDELRG